MSDYPSAVSHPGPAAKLWPQRNRQTGIILHSMEGSLAAALAVLDAPLDPSSVSWHYSIAKDGTVYEHYRLDESPWHVGSAGLPQGGNSAFIGVEHEGVAGEELTEPQFQASYALCVWIAAQSGWVASRDAAVRTLWEHHEIAGTSTTCPNGRIPWYRYVPAPQGDEDSMADRQEVEGSQDIGLVNAVVAAALGRLVAGDESQGDELFVRRGPSTDLASDEGELIIRTKLVNIPPTTGSP